MKKFLVPMTLAGALSLGGCTAMDQYGLASSYGSPTYGSGYGGSGYGGSAYGQGGPSFQDVAVENCAMHAQRYGRVSVGSVRQIRADTMGVYGAVDMNNSYQRRAFECHFRSDGRVTGFDLD